MSEPTFLPFAKPVISDEAIQEVVDCLRSGWITTGPRVQKFEDMLTEYHKGRRALCVTSATAGLQLALQAIGLKEGDEVITSPMTFVATLNTIVLAGGKPVLVDIAPNSLNMNVRKLEEAITPRTKAIMPVHFAGLPVDLDSLYLIARRHNLRVIEDCAHSIGAEYKGRRLGCFGDIQVMSFHPNKNMTTGEGGAIITMDSDIIHNIERLRFHGIDRSAFNRFSKSGSQQYDVIMPGYKYNMMDIQAALGIHQLPALQGFIHKRTQLAERYYELLSDWPEVTLPALPSYDHLHAWHLYTVLINANAAGIDRDRFINAMKEANIGVGLHYQSAHVFSWYREHCHWKPEDFPNALSVGERICSLPLFPTLTNAQQDQVVMAMSAILRQTDAIRAKGKA